MSTDLTVPSSELAAEKTAHALTKTKLAALREQSRMHERKMRRLKFLVRAKHSTFLAERAAHRTTLERLHSAEKRHRDLTLKHTTTLERLQSAEKRHLDLTLKHTILRGKFQTRKKGEKNMDRLKLAYLALQRRCERLVEERRLLEEEVGLYRGIPGALRECRERVEDLEGRLALDGGEGGGRCNIV